MSNQKMAKGSCLCGAVKVLVKNFNPEMHACHCGMCRKLTGGPLFAVDCGTGVAFEGEENISVYNSSDWAERGFCAKCGSSLFYRLKVQKHYFIPAGLFERSESFTFVRQIFIDEKPNHYEFKNETQNITGEEVFAQFS